MVMSTFSGRVQFTALSIFLQLMKIVRVKFPKILLGDYLKEFIDWESVISSVISDLHLKNVNI